MKTIKYVASAIKESYELFKSVFYKSLIYQIFFKTLYISTIIILSVFLVNFIYNFINSDKIFSLGNILPIAKAKYFFILFLTIVFFLIIRYVEKNGILLMLSYKRNDTKIPLAKVIFLSFKKTFNIIAKRLKETKKYGFVLIGMFIVWSISLFFDFEKISKILFSLLMFMIVVYALVVYSIKVNNTISILLGNKNQVRRHFIKREVTLFVGYLLFLFILFLFVVMVLLSIKPFIYFFGILLGSQVFLISFVAICLTVLIIAVPIVFSSLKYSLITILYFREKNGKLKLNGRKGSDKGIWGIKFNAIMTVILLLLLFFGSLLLMPVVQNQIDEINLENSVNDNQNISQELIYESLDELEKEHIIEVVFKKVLRYLGN